MPTAEKPAAKKKAHYKALTGISYPPNKRVEPGDVVDDLPAESIKWLLEDGEIELTKEPVTGARVDLEPTSTPDDGGDE